MNTIQLFVCTTVIFDVAGLLILLALFLENTARVRLQRELHIMKEEKEQWERMCDEAVAIAQERGKDADKWAKLANEVMVSSAKTIVQMQNEHSESYLYSLIVRLVKERDAYKQYYELYK